MNPTTHPKMFTVVAYGDELLPTDVYLSTSGDWQPCPCPGAINRGELFYRRKA